MNKFFTFILFALSFISVFAQNRQYETWTISNETSQILYSTIDFGMEYRRNGLGVYLGGGRQHRHPVDVSKNSRGELAFGNFGKLGFFYRSHSSPRKYAFPAFFTGVEFTYAEQKAVGNVFFSNTLGVTNFKNVYRRQTGVVSVPIGISYFVGDMCFDFGARVNFAPYDKYSVDGQANSSSEADVYFNTFKVPTPGISFIELGRSNSETAVSDIVDVDLFLRVRYTFAVFGYYY